MKQHLHYIAFVMIVIFCTNLAAKAQRRTPMQSLVDRTFSKSEVANVTSLLQLNQSNPGPSVAEKVSKATFLTLNFNELKTLLANNNKAITLQIPINEQQNFVVELAQYNILSGNFEVFTQKNGVNIPFDYEAGLFYRGVVKGYPGSLAAFSLFEGELYGIFSLPGMGNFAITPNTMIVKPNNEHYLMYNDADMLIDNSFSCGTATLDDEAIEDNRTAERTVYNNCKDVEVYWHADYATYLSRSSDATAVTNYLLSAFNITSTLYRNEGIYTSMKTIVVNVAPDVFYTLSPLSTSNFLAKFGELTQNNLQGADFAQLVSTRFTGVGGYAWINVNCRSYYAPQHSGPYAFTSINSSNIISNFPTYQRVTKVLTHEMGHNLGPYHTHRCGTWSGGIAIDDCGILAGFPENGTCATGGTPVKGTIMSYCDQTGQPGIDFTLGFGPQPGNLIRTRVATVTNTCYTNYTPQNILTAPNTITTANRECSDGTTTYYWDDNNTADKLDDILILKVVKNTNDIGDLDDVGFEVESGTLATAASINLPSGLPGVQNYNAAMKRYWKLTPISQPTSNVEVVFPFSQQDITDIGDQVSGFTSHSQMLIYKVSDAVDPNPALGLSGANLSNTKAYSFTTGSPSLTQWAYSSTGSTRFARFLVSSFSGGSGFGTSGTPLSNDILIFNAMQSKGSVHLKWETEDEQNLAHYTIERSADGQLFEPLIKVSALNIAKATYVKRDNYPLQGNNFYRLIATTQDGQHKTSGVVKVNFSQKQSVKIYPNPASNVLHIDLANEEANAGLYLIDATGRQVLSAHLNQSNNTIDISNVAKGVYFLQIELESSKVYHKVIID